MGAALLPLIVLGGRSPMADDTPGYVQLIPSEVDALGLAFYDRALLVDLVLLADWRPPHVVSLTYTALAEHLRTGRKAMTKALGRLERAGLITLAMVRGHEGSITVLAYGRLVKSARVDGRERPAETQPLGSIDASDQGEPLEARRDDSLASMNANARVDRPERCVDGRERPAVLPGRYVDVVDASASARTTHHPLAERLLATVEKKRPDECESVVRHLLRHVAAHKVDEAIGALATWQNPPQWPSVLVGEVRKRTPGVKVPDWRRS